MEARCRITKNREQGQSVSDKLKAIRKATAGNLFLAGSCRIGEEILLKVKGNKEKLLFKERAAKNK